MRIVVLVLGLACASQGRRVHMPNQEQQNTPLTSLANLLGSDGATSAAFQGSAVPSRPGTKLRVDPSSVAMRGKVINAFNGLKNRETFNYREIDVGQAPVKLLTRLSELRVITALADSGLLSAAERAGVFSKLEAAGAFSKAEQLLPLIEKSNILSALQFFIDCDEESWRLFAGYLRVGPVWWWFFGWAQAFYPLPTEPLDIAKCLTVSLISFTIGTVIDILMYYVRLIQFEVASKPTSAQKGINFRPPFIT